MYHDDGCLFCGANCLCAQLSPSNSRNTRYANMGEQKTENYKIKGLISLSINKPFLRRKVEEPTIPKLLCSNNTTITISIFYQESTVCNRLNLCALANLPNP